jgi:hypothetical protein
MDPSLKRDVPASAANPTTLPSARTNKQQKKPSLGRILSLPPKWLSTYEEFITKNAGQVSQIESALRSLTYIIPGKLARDECSSLELFLTNGQAAFAMPKSHQSQSTLVFNFYLSTMTLSSKRPSRVCRWRACHQHMLDIHDIGRNGVVHTEE